MEYYYCVEAIRLLIFFIFGVTLPAGILSFVWSMIITDMAGLAPYVPTSKKVIKEILSQANLKKGQKFYDLGSGDGAVLETAVKDYGVSGIGLEINPFLVFLARIKSNLKKINDISFKRGDYLKANLKDAQVIFVYTIPKVIPQLKKKLSNECRKGTLVISYTFPLEGLKLIKTLAHDRHSTFFYQI